MCRQSATYRNSSAAGRCNIWGEPVLREFSCSFSYYLVQFKATASGRTRANFGNITKQDLAGGRHLRIGLKVDFVVRGR